MVFTMPEQVNPALVEEDVLKILPQFQKYFDKDAWDSALSLNEQNKMQYVCHYCQKTIDDNSKDL